MHSCRVGAGPIATKKFAKAKYKERGKVLAEDQLAQILWPLEKDFDLRCRLWGIFIIN
uniref:Uncharacterized protein n=1 Tax=Piliocolobus tephrosceles TaxID=591936 RepID=A0A8C9IXB0_9PRIM